MLRDDLPFPPLLPFYFSFYYFYVVVVIIIVKEEERGRREGPTRGEGKKGKGRQEGKDER